MIKIFLISGAVLLITVIVLIIYVRIASRPITKKQAVQEINTLLAKEVEKNETVTSGIVLLDTLAFGIQETFTAGEINGQSVTPDQPFHVASVGKTFTATLIGILIDTGQINLDDRIADHLPVETLSGLFVFEGKDYAQEVTVAQLLNHTSGVADYFEGPVTNGKPMNTMVFDELDRFWTPQDLVAFSRDQQQAVGKPGDQFHYSDTGYILLGLLIEEVSGKPFHMMLHENIFVPLEMDDTYLMFYSEPKNGKRPISDIWFEGVEITDQTALSIDWAGGGLISTAADLATFVRALNQGQIITDQTLTQLYTFDQKYRQGIHYGLGFMEFHFNEFFPTLGAYPKLRGHMGILGTQMLYDQETGTVYISNFGSTDYPAGSVRTMIKVLGIAMRAQVD